MANVRYVNPHFLNATRKLYSVLDREAMKEDNEQCRLVEVRKAVTLKLYLLLSESSSMAELL